MLVQADQTIGGGVGTAAEVDAAVGVDVAVEVDVAGLLDAADAAAGVSATAPLSTTATPVAPAKIFRLLTYFLPARCITRQKCH
jgi:hypothetical protein